MPAYSFNIRFVPMVLDGSKRQTIRARRKNPAKVGDTLYLYSGLRTKYCKKLREEKCIKTYSIIITENNIYTIDIRMTDEEFRILKENESLDKYLEDILYRAWPITNSKGFIINLQRFDVIQRDKLAWSDGFRPDESSFSNPDGCYELMKRYFAQTHELPFIGDIIFW